MGEGMDFSWLSGLLGGSAGDMGANFGAGVGQPQLQGMFGGTPSTPGGNLMAGAMPTMPTMANFDTGTLPQGAQPLSFGMGGYGGQSQMPNLSMLGALGGGLGQKSPQPQAAPMMAGGGGGGNMRGLFSSLMQSGTPRHVNPTLGILGNFLG